MRDWVHLLSFREISHPVDLTIHRRAPSFPIGLTPKAEKPTPSCFFWHSAGLLCDDSIQYVHLEQSTPGSLKQKTRSLFPFSPSSISVSSVESLGSSTTRNQEGRRIEEGRPTHVLPFSSSWKGDHLSDGRMRRARSRPNFEAAPPPPPPPGSLSLIFNAGE